MAMGMPPGKHAFGEVHVEISGDRAYVNGTTTLAGAVVPLDECVKRFHQFAGCGHVRALEAASLRAAQALGIDSSKGRLRVGADADLILLDDDLAVHATYMGGVKAWSADGGFVARFEGEEAMMAGGGITPARGVGEGMAYCLKEEGGPIGSGRDAPAQAAGGSKRKKLS